VKEVRMKHCVYLRNLEYRDEEDEVAVTLRMNYGVNLMYLLYVDDEDRVEVSL